MHSFTDAEGRSWSIAMTFDSLTRVRSVCQVDLTRLSEGDPPLLARLDEDLMLLGELIWILIEPEAARKNISGDDLARAMTAEALAAAREAFWGELLDFFQHLARTDHVLAIEKQRKLTAAAIVEAGRRIGRLDVDATVTAGFNGTTPGTTTTPPTPGSSPAGSLGSSASPTGP